MFLFLVVFSSLLCLLYLLNLIYNQSRVQKSAVLQPALNIKMGRPVLSYQRTERSGREGLTLQDFDPRFTNSELSQRSRWTDAQREEMNAERLDRTDHAPRVSRRVRQGDYRGVASARGNQGTSTDRASRRSARRRTVSREVETIIASRDISGRTRLQVETIARVTVQEMYDGEGMETDPPHRQETQQAGVPQRSRSISSDSDPMSGSGYSRRMWPPSEGREAFLTHSPEAVSNGVITSPESAAVGANVVLQDESARSRAAEPALRRRERQITRSRRSVRESTPRPRRQSSHGDTEGTDGSALVRMGRRRTDQPIQDEPEPHTDIHGGGGWRIHTVSSYLAVLNAMTPHLPQIPASRVPRPQRIEMSRHPVAGGYHLPQAAVQETVGFANDGEIQWPSIADRLSLTERYERVGARGSEDGASQSNVQDILRNQRPRQRALQREAATERTGIEQSRTSNAYTSDNRHLEEAYRKAYRRLDESCCGGSNRLELQAKLQAAIDNKNLGEDMKRLGLW